jgi:hypothetical protein
VTLSCSGPPSVRAAVYPARSSRSNTATAASYEVGSDADHSASGWSPFSVRRTSFPIVRVCPREGSGSRAALLALVAGVAEDSEPAVGFVVDVEVGGPAAVGAAGAGLVDHARAQPAPAPRRAALG